MTTPFRVAGFVLGLVAVFLVAQGVGAVAGPGPVAPAAGHAGMSGGHGESTSQADPTPVGLQVSEQGYTLRVLSDAEQGTGQTVSFVIEDDAGRPVTDFDVVHEQPLHLIKIRRDGEGFEHVHPTLADDGTWTAELDLAPGATRLFADFTPTGGPALVLGTDVQVAGDYRPAPAPEITRVATVDGYRVELSGDLVAGESSPVTVTITRGGEPVTDLQPYLGAYGHLVALREGDLAYLHVHPEDAGPGPEVPFQAEVPSVGRYRLFLDFRHDDVVRTAAFVLRAEEAR